MPAGAARPGRTVARCPPAPPRQRPAPRPASTPVTGQQPRGWRGQELPYILPLVPLDVVSHDTLISQQERNGNGWELGALCCLEPALVAKSLQESRELDFGGGLWAHAFINGLGDGTRACLFILHI